MKPGDDSVNSGVEAAGIVMLKILLLIFSAFL
jgi:hypothetical protein